MSGANFQAEQGSANVIVPTDISGLKGWWKADAGVFSDAGVTIATNGNTVQQWSDQSGNGKNASQANAGQRPIYRSSINGLPAIEFVRDNHTQLLAGANSDFVDTSFTVFIVFQRKDVGPTTAYEAVLNKGDGSDSTKTVWEIITRLGTPSYITRFDTGHGATTNSDCTMNSMLLQDMLCAKRIDNSNKAFYRNGYQVTTGGDGGNAINAGATKLGIGSDGNTGNNLACNCYIREILYYNSALSDTNRQAVERYLSRKWGILGSIPVTASGQPLGGGHSNTSGYGFVSYDLGNTFNAPTGLTNPVLSFPGPNGVGTTTDTETCSVLYSNGAYWLVHEVNDTFLPSVPTQVSFNLLKTTCWPSGPWNYVSSPAVFNSLVPGSVCWDPRWFVDDDGSVYVTVMAGNNISTTYNDQIYVIKSNDPGTFSSWGTPTLLTGTGLPTAFDEHFLVEPRSSPFGKYSLFGSDITLQTMNLYTSSTLTSGYVLERSDVFNVGVEQATNVAVYKHDNIWRVYCFPRGHSDQLYYLESTDGWATWGGKNTVFGGWSGLGTGQVGFSTSRSVGTTPWF